MFPIFKREKNHFKTGREGESESGWEVGLGRGGVVRKAFVSPPTFTTSLRARCFPSGFSLRLNWVPRSFSKLNVFFFALNMEDGCEQYSSLGDLCM